MVGTINATHGEISQNNAYTTGLTLMLKGCLLDPQLLGQHGVPLETINTFTKLA